MINITDTSKCCGCGACASSCPALCIEMKADDEGFYYPTVKSEACIHCNICENVCPFINKGRSSIPLKAYAAYILEDEIRFNSSSGGLFTSLADSILESNGIVYGVAMSTNCKHAEHIRVDNKDELQKLRGSKYFQASPVTVYQSIKEDLLNERSVLFSGTPCQINALKNYLNVEYEKLLCVDIVCHGVPSQKLWSKYVNSLGKGTNNVISKVNFRNKKNGWQNFALSWVSDSVEILNDKSKDPYMQMFLKNYCLRPSCYDCKSKSAKCSDITLADFWGVNKIAPELNDGKGTSMVLIRTTKGKTYFDAIKNTIHYKEVSYEDAVKDNYPEFKSVPRPSERDTFFQDMNELDFDELAKKYINTDQQKSSLKEFLASTWCWKVIKKIL